MNSIFPISFLAVEQKNESTYFPLRQRGEEGEGGGGEGKHSLNKFSSTEVDWKIPLPLLCTGGGRRREREEEEGAVQCNDIPIRHLFAKHLL